MKGELSLSDNLNKFLIMYRNTPHTLINEPPALGCTKKLQPAPILL